MTDDFHMDDELEILEQIEEAWSDASMTSLSDGRRTICPHPQTRSSSRHVCAGGHPNGRRPYGR